MTATGAQGVAGLDGGELPGQELACEPPSNANSDLLRSPRMIRVPAPVLFTLLLVLVFLVVQLSQRRAPEAAPPPAADEEPEPNVQLPTWFYWLHDAPMFIDNSLVSAFYDAVLRPGPRTVSVQQADERTLTSAAKTTYGVKAAQVLPGLELSFGGEVSDSESVKSGTARTLAPIHNPPRELTSLVIHYLDKYYEPGADGDAHRIWEQVGPADETWSAPERERIASRPRMLAVLDFPPGTMFVPMAVETEKGVTAVYEDLVTKLRERDDGPGTECPPYPDSYLEEDADKRNAYWQWFVESWSANAALDVFECVLKRAGTRPRWVNYRVPVQDGLTLHLNIVGHGDYDVGIYAYNLIKRGWKHGVRMIGTVRAEPGINVLAIFDK